MRDWRHYHPLLFAVAPAFFLWGNNFAEVSVVEVVPVLLLCILYGGAIYALSYVLLRSPDRAALLASTFIFLTLFYSQIFFNAFTLAFMRQRYALVAVALACAAVWYLVRKPGRNLRTVNEVAFVVAATFIAVSVFQLLSNSYALHRDLPNGSALTPAAEEVGEKRDIYYIILDEYAAPRMLRDGLGFDKADVLVDALERMGFFVADGSHSNYDNTIKSLPSSLNMRYIADTEIGNPSVLVRMTDDNVVKDFLHARGYRYIHFGADAFTYFNSFADENVNIGLFSPYQSAMIESTLFSAVGRAFGYADVTGLASTLGLVDRRYMQYERTGYKLDELAQISKRPEPTFVFAHFLNPHRPYVMHADGTFVTWEERESTPEDELYLGQVEFISREIARVIEELIASSDPKPIIIVQADHGYRGGEPGEDPEMRTSILNAYYFPDASYDSLYPSITPVNSLRVLLNTYFAQDFELLEDKTFLTAPDGSLVPYL